MNSMSKNYHDNDCKKEKKDCPTILKCGCPSGSIDIPTGITSANPLMIANVSVNIPKCCNPCIKLEFASTVNLNGNTFTNQEGASVPTSATFTVTIFKNCLKNVRVPIYSYTYNKLYQLTGHLSTPGEFVNLIVINTDTFSFFVCDCNTCPSECCYYSAEITSSDLEPPTQQSATTLSITNVRLSALVTSSRL